MNPPQSHGVTESEPLTQRIIGCAIEVHRVLGPGLLESIYEEAICIEFDDVGLRYGGQTRLPVYYKGRSPGEYRVDLIVDDLVLVEIKSVERRDHAAGTVTSDRPRSGRLIRPRPALRSWVRRLQSYLCDSVTL